MMPQAWWADRAVVFERAHGKWALSDSYRNFVPAADLLRCVQDAEGVAGRDDVVVIDRSEIHASKKMYISPTSVIYLALACGIPFRLRPIERTTDFSSNPVRKGIVIVRNPPDCPDWVGEYLAASEYFDGRWAGGRWHRDTLRGGFLCDKPLVDIIAAIGRAIVGIAEDRSGEDHSSFLAAMIEDPVKGLIWADRLEEMGLPFQCAAAINCASLLKKGRDFETLLSGPGSSRRGGGGYFAC